MLGNMEAVIFYIDFFPIYKRFFFLQIQTVWKLSLLIRLTISYQIYGWSAVSICSTICYYLQNISNNNVFSFSNRKLNFFLFCQPKHRRNRKHFWERVRHCCCFRSISFQKRKFFHPNRDVLLLNSWESCSSASTK